MSPLRLVFACGAWLVCCVAGAAALDTLDACASHASAQARGVVALEAQCPGLEAALRETGIVDNLPAGWRDTLNDVALRDLGVLVRRYQAAATRVAPDPAGMPAVLDQLRSEQAKPVHSWWEALRRWLTSWLSRQDVSSVHWLDRLLDRLAQSADLLTVATYVLLGLVVAAAAWLVFNELRAAGVLSRGRKDGRDRSAAGLPQADELAPESVSLDALAPRDQATVLLRLLVARLLANGQLRAERSLTHRELVTHSSFGDAENRRRFARVTQLAERVLYGSGEASAAQASTVIAEGRQLLTKLQAAGTAPA